MPNYSDLQEIKEKIQSLGNEPEILKNKELPINDTPLPDEASKNDEIIQENIIPEDTDELMSDILDDFEKGDFIEDDDAGQKIDTSDLDDLLGGGLGESEASEEMPVSGDELENLLGDMQEVTESGEKSDSDDLDNLLGEDLTSQKSEDIMDEPSEEVPVGESKVDVDDLSDLLGEGPSELSIDKDENIIANNDELNELLEGVDIGSPAKKEEASKDILSDESVGDGELDALMSDFGEETESESETSEEMPVSGDELGDLLGDISTGEASDITAGTEVEEDGLMETGLSDLDNLLGGGDLGGQEASEEMPVSGDELGDLLGDISVGEASDITAGTEAEEDGLMETGLSDLDDLLGDGLGESEASEEIPVSGDELGDLLGDISAGADSTIPEEIENLSETGADETMAFTDELADFDFGMPSDEKKGQEPPALEEDIFSDMGVTAEEGVGDDLSGGFEGDDILENLGQENEPITEMQDLDSLLGEDVSMPSSVVEKGDEDLAGSIPEELQKSDLGGEDDFNLDALEDISALESESIGIEAPELSQMESDDFGSFDFDKLDAIGSEDVGSQEDLIYDEGPVIMDSSFGEIPVELSEEDVKKDQDVEIDLSDDERKQVVISLRNLPKDAEIKISKAIISNKYSNAQLKPLIDALIGSESPQIVIKYYERITGDKSLSQIEAIKHAGVKFEERQKTFAYVFEKNIVPILSKLMAALAVVVLIALFIGIVVWPRIKADSRYRAGKKLIEEKKFSDAQEKFNEAFDIHPKYSQAVDYARRYSKNKRYLAAEKMYDLAVSMKPDKKSTILEFADMFRESKNYERAESKYRGFLKGNEKDIDALLGLAKTYFDWSDEEAGRIDDARQTYLDVLDIDKNNREAVFGNLSIHIKKNNYTDVIKHYNYIEKKFGKKVDPVVYTKLAEYLIDTGDVEDVKDIIKKASASLKRGQLLPELEYQKARYNKSLNTYPDERESLIRAKDQIEEIKNASSNEGGKKKSQDMPLYDSVKYDKLLSKIYNDLGENYEISEKASLEAKKYYEQAIVLNPSFGKAYFNLATYYLNYVPNGYEGAKSFYEEAEKNGFTNDRLNFNLGWLYYREREYYNSYGRMAGVFEKEPDNSNLKYIIGTIFYKMGKYDLSESLLLETYMHFEGLSDQYYPLDPNEKEGKIILEMIEKVGNNLGATYQKKYEETRNSKYIISATKYYQDSIMAFDKLINRDDREVDINIDTSKTPVEGEFTKFRKENAHINLRMVLYPDAGLGEPVLYEDFPLDYSKFM